MNALVTSQEVAGYLRLDGDADETDVVSLLIGAASEAVLTYLEWKDVPDPVPVVAKAATLRLVGEMYASREGATEGQIQPQFGYGYLPASVIGLLYPLRVPSVA